MPKIPDEPGWQRKKIQVVDRDGNPVGKGFQAEVLGVVAVHEAIGEGSKVILEKWSVTSVSSGMQVLFLPSKYEALRTGEMLSKKFVVGLSKKTKMEVVAKLPQWFKAWAMDSQKAGRGLPMEQYEGKR